MTESEQLAMLAPEDVVKLQAERQPFGCLVILIAALLIVVAVLAILWNSAPTWVAAYGVISLAVFAFYFNYRKKTNRLIDRDIWGARKNVIVAPIQSKRIDSSEIKRGSRQGEISSNYYMTIRGIEYDMNESDYLDIRLGEFIEIHIAPLSKTVIHRKWLRADGTSAVLNEDSS